MGFRLQSFQKSLTGGEGFLLFSFARSQISPAEKDLAIITPIFMKNFSKPSLAILITLTYSNESLDQKVQFLSYQSSLSSLDQYFHLTDSPPGYHRIPFAFPFPPFP